MLLGHLIAIYRYLLLVPDSVRLPTRSKLIRWLMVDLLLILKLHLNLIYIIRRDISSLIWRLRLFLWRYYDWVLLCFRIECGRLCVKSWMLKPAIISCAFEIELTLCYFFFLSLSWWTRCSTASLRCLMIAILSKFRGRVHYRRLVSTVKSKVFICYIPLLLHIMLL